VCLIRSCHGPYRLSWIPLAGTCYYSIAKKVLQLIHNIYCRIVECQFVLINIFGARTKPCTNLLCFMQRQAIYFRVCHSQVPSHYHVWHDFIIPTREKNGITTYLKRKRMFEMSKIILKDSHYSLANNKYNCIVKWTQKRLLSLSNTLHVWTLFAHSTHLLTDFPYICQCSYFYVYCKQFVRNHTNMYSDITHRKLHASSACRW